MKTIVFRDPTCNVLGVPTRNVLWTSTSAVRPAAFHAITRGEQVFAENSPCGEQCSSRACTGASQRSVIGSSDDVLTVGQRLSSLYHLCSDRAVIRQLDDGRGVVFIMVSYTLFCR